MWDFLVFRTWGGEVAEAFRTLLLGSRLLSEGTYINHFLGDHSKC